MRAFFLFALFTACSTDTFVTPDASGGGDTGGGDAVTTCTPSFCASQTTTTCNDFDTDTTPTKWFDDPTNSGNIAVGTTQSTTTSCPSALQVTMPAMAQAAVGAEPHGYVVTVLGNPGDVTVNLDAYIPNIPNGDAGIADGVVLFSLRATVDGTWSVRLERSGDTAWFLRVHQGTNNGQNAPVTNIRTDAWNHMTLTVHYKDDSTGSASLTYQTQSNGQQTANVSNQPTLPNTGAQEVSSFAVGAAALTAISQSYTFLYDSITIAAK
jgi:hypothetical protein